jgi:predicted RNA-binding Zn-ribbon protein involved in translation (DUF1610 family)
VCPECGSNDISIREYDFGVCQQTGYRDAGQRYVCRACGAQGAAADLDRGSVAMSANRAA